MSGEPRSPWSVKPTAAMTKREWRGRLGTYLLGVAIGLLMLGLLHLARQRAAQQAGPTAPVAPTPAPAR